MTTYLVKHFASITEEIDVSIRANPTDVYIVESVNHESNTPVKTRREIWKDFILLTGLASLARTSAAQSARSALQCFQLGAISDGFSQDFGEALRVMESYGLSWVEIRNVFGIYNTDASPEQVRQLRQLLARYRFRVSVIDSAVFKCALPGTTPVKGEKLKFDYPQQLELLKRAIDRADALGSDKIRAFTFWRVAHPEQVAERVAEELLKAAEIAQRANKRLVIEDEESCNAATAHELTAILKRAPAANLGVNWDVGNGYWEGEVSYPNGYGVLDKSRIWHMHVKDVRCDRSMKKCAEAIVGTGQVDLVGQLKQLLADGYKGTMSLECEFEAPGLTHLETSKRSLEGLLKVMASAAQGRTCRASN